MILKQLILEHKALKKHFGVVTITSDYEEDVKTIEKALKESKLRDQYKISYTIDSDKW